MKDFLAGLGIEGEAAEKIIAEVDKKVSDANSWTNADKAALEKENQRLREQAEEANKTISRLEASNNENKNLVADINAYKKKIEALEERASKDKIDYAVDLALERAGAINPKTVRPLLDMNKIVIGKDGSVAGVEEQVSAITGDESNAFLFRQPEPEPAEAQPVAEVRRGGYEPLAADSRQEPDGSPEKPGGQSYGAIAAEYISSQKGSAEQKVQDFWSSN